MSKDNKINCFVFLILGVIIFIILAVLYGVYRSMGLKLGKIIINNEITFQVCTDYIFSEKKSREIEIQEYINKNDYKVLELKCFIKFPNKREAVVITEDISHSFIIKQKHTAKEQIILPKNVLLDKSTIDIEFKIPKANITRDVTFFGYSLGKLQNRDGTTRIGATKQNVINKSFTLADIYYNDNPEFIVSNLKGNDIQASYTIHYSIKQY